jgi:hypothetical protein
MIDTRNMRVNFNFIFSHLQVKGQKINIRAFNVRNFQGNILNYPNDFIQFS